MSPHLSLAAHRGERQRGGEEPEGPYDFQVVRERGLCKRVGG